MDKKKENQKIHLVPELCYMTGLSDQMRNNFQLMKGIAEMTKLGANEKNEKIQELIRRLRLEGQQVMQEYGLDLDENPVVVQGDRLESGNMLFGNNNQVRIEDNRDLDRQAQTQLLQCKKLGKWAILYPQRDQEIFNNFINTMKQSLGQYNYQCNPPNCIAISSNNVQDWKNRLSIIDGSVDLVVLLLNGPKKNAPMYSELKKFCHEKGVPVQVVLVSTVRNGKGLRSVCNKLVCQICAKTGGVPWSITEMPFNSRPTMLIGIDVYQKIEKGSKKYVTALVGTVDRYFGRYYSDVRMNYSDQNTSQSIYEMAKNAFQQFQKISQRFPDDVIVFREGSSEGQIKTIIKTEIQGDQQAKQGIRKAMDTLQMKAKMMVLAINKKSNQSVFLRNGNRLGNPLPGTVVQGGIVDKNSFMLVSQKATQGVPSPIKYTIIWNDYVETNDMIQKIKLLAFKMCHMYYNWTGAVKVPAPCQIANKLANFHGERYNQITVSQELLTKCTQYFI